MTNKDTPKSAKKEEIREFLTTRQRAGTVLLKSYIEDSDSKKYPMRTNIPPIKTYISDFLTGAPSIRSVAIAGLRGVGKTTLLAQLFMTAYKDYVTQAHFLYLSVDQIVNLLDSSLYEVLYVYEEILGTSFEELKKPLLLFLDEVHYDPKWSHVLKALYDRSPHIFVVSTGSSALSLTAAADLSRRVLLERMAPMSFTEYVSLKSAYEGFDPPLNQEVLATWDSAPLRHALFQAPSAKDCYEGLASLEPSVDRYCQNLPRFERMHYLKYGTLPFALKFNDEAQLHVFTDQLIERIIFKDLAEYNQFSRETLSQVKSLLLMVASSSIVSHRSVASYLEGLSVNTLREVLAALEKAYILQKVYAYGSDYKKVRKPAKYYFTSPAFRYSLMYALNGEQAYAKYKGYLFEDIAAGYLQQMLVPGLGKPLFYDSAQGGADFILDRPDRCIVVEIGAGQKTYAQVAQTMRSIGGDYGLIFSESPLEKSPLEMREEMVKVPWKFALLL